MNLKFKKLYATLGVGLLSALSFTPTLNTQAALTAPTSWTFKYTTQDFPGYKLRNSTSVISTPTYTRTTDGAYYNYTSTFQVINGLQVTQTFNRSNTTWYSTGTDYIPSDTKIGSDNTVGSSITKFDFTIDNQTNLNYRLMFDFSSTSVASFPVSVTYSTGVWYYMNAFNTTVLENSVFIPAYSTARITRITSTFLYLDAWYLQDLGISAAYEEGVDDGYIQGQDDADLLVTGFSAMVGILVNFVLMIVNLQVFGVSLMGLFSIVILFASIVWGLKLIRG